MILPEAASCHIHARQTQLQPPTLLIEMFSRFLAACGLCSSESSPATFPPLTHNPPVLFSQQPPWWTTSAFVLGPLPLLHQAHEGNWAILTQQIFPLTWPLLSRCCASGCSFVFLIQPGSSLGWMFFLKTLLCRTTEFCFLTAVTSWRVKSKVIPIAVRGKLFTF